MAKKKPARDDSTPTLFKLTAEARVRLGAKLAKAVRAKEQCEAEFSDVKNDFKERLDAFDEEISKIASTLNQGAGEKPAATGDSEQANA